ncbi:MAG: PEP-CTERM sorting domain-containing protein [Tepidisphaeraceae bacterium]
MATITAPSARADGTWVGGVVSFPPPYRSWTNPGNWNGGVLPGVADPLFFETCGDGSVDLGGVVRSNPSVSFGDWVTYTLTGAPPAGSTLKLTGAVAPQITVGNTVQATYGSDYFANGNVIATNLDLESAGGTTIDFTGINGGVLNLEGAISGPSFLTLTESSSIGTGEVYFGNANGGYAGLVTVNSGTAVRLLDGGRTGAGSVQLNGGRFDILSSTGAQGMGNTINSSTGSVFADLNWSDPAVPAPAPTTDSIGPVLVDNPGALGGTTAASIGFQADNEFNFESSGLFLGNSAGFVAPSRTISVKNGDLREGIDGSTLQTGPNNLNKVVVTAQMDSLFDLSGGGGLSLVKSGGGVLAIGGDNETTSEGAKFVLGGTLRFLTGKSYGTVLGVVGGVPVTVTLEPAGGPGTPVGDAMGIGYADPAGVPVNLATAGTVPGQSGAIDIDVLGDPAAVILPMVNTAGALTALRVGSSGVGSLTGAVIPYTPVGGGFSEYYLGGGGGSLTITAPLGAGAAGAALTTAEMGTTGDLLPGEVTLTAAVGYHGATSIKAGTLHIPGAGILKPSAVTHLGTYSKAILTGAAYGGAPAGTPYNGPGQLLLSAAGGFGAYAYGPAGSFGAGGLLLDGGAVGYDGAIVLPAIPGTYGAAIPSTLYESDFLPAAPVPTDILHLGGENSLGTMTVAFPITDSGPTPVALIKSGINSVLDLTAMPGANTATGGTGIMGGAVAVNAPTQLGPAVVTIADGGILHVKAGGPSPVAFTQILRVANGPGRRGSVVNVDAGVTATFDIGGGPGAGGTLQADAEQSVLEKEGGGVLDILPGFLFPSSDPTNTWGVKVDSGLLEINQLPGIATPANGEAIFAGSAAAPTPAVLHLVGPTSPGGIPIPASTQYSPNYGFSGISTYAGTNSYLFIDNAAFFRVDGFNPSNLMGSLAVYMGPTSVFKVSGAPGGGTLDTSGTGSVDFNGGNVQFSPTDTHFLLPQDGAFSLHLNGTAASPVLFSGCANSDINGNLYFNDDAGSSAVAIDGATVDNTPTPFSATWTVGGTGLTSWNGTVIKGSTQAVPGGGGPFTTGTVDINHCAGAPVNVAAGSLLIVSAGTFEATGGTDPFTDNSTGATHGNHVAVVNNAAFEVLGVNATIEGITGTGTLTVGDGVTGNTLSLATNSGGSSQDALSIAGPSALDIENNHIYINYGGGPDPVAAIRAYLINGRNGGLWNGTGGINSSTAALPANSAYSLGYADSADPGNPAGLAANQIEVKYTLLGDATLTGTVTGTDFTILATNLGKVVSGWDQGDFLYTGTVTGSDFTALVTNLGKTASGADVALPASVYAAVDAFAAANGLMADVPEPSSIGLLTLGAIGLLAPRRRTRLAMRN